jgi:uncharacterized LabA/DUF88 family protein
MELKQYTLLNKQYPNERVQVFIDQSNLYKAVEHNYPRIKLDAAELARKLVGGRKLVRTNIYISTLSTKREPQQATDQHRFIDALRNIPFVTVHTRPLRYSANRKWEKGVDILIASHMLTQAYNRACDTVLLISGDGDYAPVIQEVKRFGIKVENAFLKRSRSGALREHCDVFINLTEHLLTECSHTKKAAPAKAEAT